MSEKTELEMSLKFIATSAECRPFLEMLEDKYYAEVDEIGTARLSLSDLGRISRIQGRMELIKELLNEIGTTCESKPNINQSRRSPADLEGQHGNVD